MKPAATYQGKPCVTCGSTEKYESCYSCVKCRKANSKTHKRVSPYSPEALEKKRMHARRWYANPANRRKANLTKTLRVRGITKAALDRMFVEQEHRCGGCGIELKDDRFTHIDHDHATGKVRGLLCNRCNSVIGFARDNTDTLHALIRYLEVHRG